MKTFRELISWELEQDAEKRTEPSLTKEDAGAKLNASVLRKLKYLNAAGSASEGSAESFSPA